MSADSPVDEERCRRFEEHRLSGGDGPLDDFLPAPDEPSYGATLEELVAMELEIRWKAHAADAAGRVDPPSLGEYRARFPGLGDGSMAGRLEKEEAWLRQRFGRGDLEAPGSRVGRYVLVRRVGHGAFAAVWRARDDDLHRDVAIKVPRIELGTDVTALARVMREARSAGSLRHPSIVPVHEVVEHDGRPCIVSEFVDGPTLAAVIAERPFTPDEAATLVAQLADALAYAHENGVVHRDVKPGNVLLEPNGRPVLTDFGLAQAGSADATLTRKGEILGTPAYMSPEQARGDRESVDGRSDVYSLGAVLYEMLTRRRPFHEASTAALLYAVVHQEPVRPRALDRRLPHDLATICLTAMAKERERRYASAGEMAADLRRYLDRRPISARRPGPVGRALLWVRRRPAVAATLAVSALVLTAVTTVAFVRVVDERDRERVSLYRSLLREAEAEIAAHETGWLTRARAAVAHAAGIETPARDDVALRSLLLRCELSPNPSFELQSTWKSSGPVIEALSASRDGRVVVSADAVGSLVVQDVTGREVARVAGAGSEVADVAVHPDGRVVLVATRDGGLALRAVSAPSRPTWESGSTDGVTRLAWSDDGVAAAVGRVSGRVDVMRLDGDGLAQAATLQSPGGEVHSLVFSVDGERLAAGYGDGWLRVWEWRSGEQSASLSLTHPSRALAFDATGRRLVFAEEQSLTCVSWDTTDPLGRLTPPIAQHQRDVVHLDVDSRGRVLTASLDGSIALSNSAGRLLAAARGTFPAVVAAAFGDDGRIAVASYRDGSVRCWRIVEPDALTTRGGTHSAAFVPGTRRLLTARPAIIDYGNGGEPVTLGPPGWNAVSLLATPDHRALVALETGDVVAVDPEKSRTETAVWASFGESVSIARRVRPGGVLAVAGASGTVRVYTGGATGSTVAEHRLGAGPVLDVAPLGTAGDVVAVTPAGVLLVRVGEAARLLPGLSSAGSAPPARLAAAPGMALIAAADGAVVRITADAEVVEPVRDIDVGEAHVTAFDTSEEGNLLAFGDSLGRLHVCRPFPDAPIRVTELGGAPIESVQFDPAGEYIVLDAGAHSAIVDVRSGAPIAVVAWTIRRLQAWNSDGGLWSARPTARTVFEVPREALHAARRRVIDAGAGPDRFALADELVVFGQLGLEMIWGVATSPDGRLVATASHGGTIALRDAATLASRRELLASGDVAWTVAFSADSRRVVAGSGSDAVVFDVATGAEVARLTCGETLLVGAAWHSGGALIATATLGGRAALWDVRDVRDVRRVADLVPDVGVPLHDIRFDPSGTRLAAARDDGVVLVWDVDAADVLAGGAVEEPRALTGHGSAAWALAWDRDGRYLASGSERGEVILRDGTTLVPLAHLQHSANQVRSLSFDDEAQLLSVETYRLPAATWKLAELRQRLAEFGLDW